jgi:putative oxidoreductase
MGDLSRFRPTVLGVLRILSGLLFMQHGVQKLFGWLGGSQMEIASMMGVAGILETFGGLLIVFGLLTRPIALLLAGEMLVAYLTAHLPQGFFPIQNGGELAVLYFAIFLYLAVAGPGRFSIDGARERSTNARREGQALDAAR